MTPSVIYYDFRQANNPLPEPESTTVLTARVLIRGRRWHKFWNSAGKVLDTTCLALCGSCIAVSLAILCHILLF